MWDEADRPWGRCTQMLLSYSSVERFVGFVGLGQRMMLVHVDLLREH
jgi:hypothetical protein